MSVAVRGSKSHEDDGLSQRLLEARADRDRTALAIEDRSLAEGRLQCPGSCLCHRMVDRRETRPAATEIADGGPDAGRGDLLDECPEALEDDLGILVRDEPAADLGVGVGGDDRLAPLPLESAPQSVDVERRPGAASLQRGEA